MILLSDLVFNHSQVCNVSWLALRLTSISTQLSSKRAAARSRPRFRSKKIVHRVYLFFIPITARIWLQRTANSSTLCHFTILMRRQTMKVKHPRKTTWVVGRTKRSLKSGRGRCLRTTLEMPKFVAPFGVGGAGELDLDNLEAKSSGDREPSGKHSMNDIASPGCRRHSHSKSVYARRLPSLASRPLAPQAGRYMPDHVMISRGMSLNI